MRNILGMLIGAAVDRGDGDSGIKGAVIGSLVQSTVRLAAPIALTYAVGWGVIKLTRRGFGELADRVDGKSTTADEQVTSGA